MSAQSALLVRTFKVGKFTITMTFQHPGAIPAAQSIAMEWDPYLPKGLSRKEWRQYRSGRDAALQEFGRISGVNITLIEP